MIQTPRTDDPYPLISRLRKMGMRPAAIYDRLVLDGWSPDALDPLFARASADAATSRQEPALRAITTPSTMQQSVQYRSRMFSPRSVSASTIALGLIVLSAFASALYVFFKPPVVYSISIPSENSAHSAEPIVYGALPSLADKARYQSVKENFISQKASFIDANLSAMKLTVSVDGEQKLEVPILAKGRPGSWWETPAGLYKIETKEKTHFSTFGEVAMPYSLDFQGNFFIHGWPTYADGTPVSSTYSGGCIRLSTEDAQKVFNMAQVGMPVIVYHEQPAKDVFDYQIKAPKIAAEKYLVVDVKSGTVLAGKDGNVSAPVASITKLLTALVATEFINLDKKIHVPPEALVYTSVPRLRAGTSVRAYDLLFLLLQESSNEAAETLAAHTGRKQFVQYMNEKARAIGLKDTKFNDPSGAENDISTPEDIFTLLRYIEGNRRFVFEITTGKLTNTAYGETEFKGVNNFNPIKNIPADFLGGKIGQTNEAGETYAGVFSLDIEGRTRTIAVVVLGSKDSPSDVRKLLEFVKDSYAPAH